MWHRSRVISEPPRRAHRAPAPLRALPAEWLAHPSCGVVLLAMLRNRRFTQRPRAYLAGRIACALADARPDATGQPTREVVCHEMLWMLEKIVGVILLCNILSFHFYDVLWGLNRLSIASRQTWTHLAPPPLRIETISLHACILACLRLVALTVRGHTFMHTNPHINTNSNINTNTSTNEMVPYYAKPGVNEKTRHVAMPYFFFPLMYVYPCMYVCVHATRGLQKGFQDRCSSQIPFPAGRRGRGCWR